MSSSDHHFHHMREGSEDSFGQAKSLHHLMAVKHIIS